MSQRPELNLGINKWLELVRLSKFNISQKDVLLNAQRAFVLQ